MVDHFTTVLRNGEAYKAVLMIQGEPYLQTVPLLSLSAAESEARKWADDEGVLYVPSNLAEA